MLILRPQNTAQSLATRCRPITFDAFLYVYKVSFGYYAQSVSFNYTDGQISTISLSLPLSDLDEEKRDVRIFSVDSSNSVYTDILNNGGIQYNSDDWLQALDEMDTAQEIKEIFRGSMLVTDQTDLNKYKVYGN